MCFWRILNYHKIMDANIVELNSIFSKYIIFILNVINVSINSEVLLKDLMSVKVVWMPKTLYMHTCTVWEKKNICLYSRLVLYKIVKHCRLLLVYYETSTDCQRLLVYYEIAEDCQRWLVLNETDNFYWSNMRLTTFTGLLEITDHQLLLV